jgi:hypothetical protein
VEVSSGSLVLPNRGEEESLVPSGVPRTSVVRTPKSLAILGGVIRDQLPLIVLVGIFFSAGLLADIGVSLRFLIPPLGSLTLFAYVVILVLVYRWWVFVGTGMRAQQATARLFEARHFIPLVAGGTLLYWLHLVEVQAFLQWKSRIPRFHPFSLDPALARLDRALHFGVDPWRLLQPVLGHPWITLVLDKVYVAWFVVLTFVVLWQCFEGDRAKRMRFFFTYAVSWIVVGIVMGIALASVGPIFYADVVGQSGGYEPMLQYLAAVNQTHPLQALQLRDVLWRAYQEGGVTTVGGIAAMPSLHVGLSLLFAIVGWQRSRFLGIALSIFGVAVFLATIHLGWHYAIDGYVGAASVWMIWWLAGKVSWVPRATPHFF